MSNRSHSSGPTRRQGPTAALKAALDCQLPLLLGFGWGSGAFSQAMPVSQEARERKTTLQWERMTSVYARLEPALLTPVISESLEGEGNKVAP